MTARIIPFVRRERLERDHAPNGIFDAVTARTAIVVPFRALAEWVNPFLTLPTDPYLLHASRFVLGLSSGATLR